MNDNMQFEIWNLNDEENQLDADIVITDLGSKEDAVKAMLKGEFIKTGFPEYKADYELEHGSYLAFPIMNDSREEIDCFSTGGFPLINPDVPSDIFFLRENGELMGSGYRFTDAEKNAVEELIKAAIKEKEQEREL